MYVHTGVKNLSGFCDVKCNYYNLVGMYFLQIFSVYKLKEWNNRCLKKEAKYSLTLMAVANQSTKSFDYLVSIFPDLCSETKELFLMFLLIFLQYKFWFLWRKSL